MKLQTLDDVLNEQLADLYSAENQLVQAMPKVASAASTPELKSAFEHHLEETKEHVRRLEEAFSELGTEIPDHHCAGMEGLLKEGEDIVSADGDQTAKDAALIAAAQRVEHYEIAAYGTARTLADHLGHDSVKLLLNETLNEESTADAHLTHVATGGMFASGVNKAAATA